MIEAIQKLVRSTDTAVARVYLSLFRERNALVPFLFHSLFKNSGEIGLNLVDPLEQTTLAHFRQFIEYYLEHGYRFISPCDLLTGIQPDGKYAMITFDDGYFNNSLALPVLKEFNVPAIFFISTDHVLQNKCYWWDVLYRERLARGASYARIKAEARSFKTLRTAEVEARLKEWFGDVSFVPRGDIDRPFSPRELIEFASHPLVFLGNHTAGHAILVNYTPQEMREQIMTAQQSLQSMTGVRPCAIAYPNGAYNDDVIQVSAEAGLQLGFTVRPQKHGLPVNLKSTDSFRLGRFVPQGDAPIAGQCLTYRSDVLFYGMLRNGYLRLSRGNQATN